MLKVILAGLLMVAAWAQPPVAQNPVVEIKGTVSKVQIVAGQGMPHVEVKTDKGLVKVFLGPMRYLMQENFNPKAGEAVEAKGYKLNEESVIGIRVELPESKKTLKLRDEKGYPVWMFGQGMGRQ